MKFFLISFVLISLVSCSFDNKTGIWKDHNEKIIKESKIEKNSEKIFKKKKFFDQEIENKNKLIISNKIKNKNWLENNFKETNDVSHINYDNNKNLLFKSKKIGKSNSSIAINVEPLFFEESIFFSDLSGNIYNFSTISNKLIWKFNFYKKKFRNVPIKINLKIVPKNLIVSDNLGYFYNLNLDTGKLIWAKNQGVPLTSEIKSYEDKIFILNQDNKFYIFDIKNGKKILDFETFPVILKKNNKQTLALDKQNNLYFVTSAGQIFSLNHENYKINWLKTLVDATSLDEFGLFLSSSVIIKDDDIFLSSSKITTSIKTLTGSTNWEIPFGTRIRPIISGEYIFMVSKDGFLLSADKNNGNIVWSKKLFKSDKIDKKKVGDITSLFLISNKLFLTTQNGYFFFINYENGEISSYTKVARSFYSKPIVANGKIFIIDKKMRVLIFD
tara:strand:+ start:824 stop:2152 length:1329 start_codon:yes stop_codon:yes gene_type:complete